MSADAERLKRRVLNLVVLANAPQTTEDEHDRNVQAMYTAIESINLDIDSLYAYIKTLESKVLK